MPKHGGRHRPLEPSDRSIGPPLFLRISWDTHALPSYMRAPVPLPFMPRCHSYRSSPPPRPSIPPTAWSIPPTTSLARLAPNTIATLYGKNLAYGTKTLCRQTDIRGGVLPTVLPQHRRSSARKRAAGLIPIMSRPCRSISWSPPICYPGRPMCSSSSMAWRARRFRSPSPPPLPRCFNSISKTSSPPVPMVADYSAAPAKPGDLVVLYATGLGQTVPPVGYGELPNAAASLVIWPTSMCCWTATPVDSSGYRLRRHRARFCRSVSDQLYPSPVHRLQSRNTNRNRRRNQQRRPPYSRKPIVLN